MSTTTGIPAAAEAVPEKEALKPLEAGDSLTTEKVTYRGYAKVNEKGELEGYQAKAEVANQVNWKKMEAAGNTLINTNEFTRYILKTMKGFELLVPSEEQRLYISQAGLNYIQNSKANGYMNDFAEDKITPVNNDQTIDLREGINDPPQKRALTDQEKLERLVKSMGLSAEDMQKMFADLAKNFAAAAATKATAEPEAEAEPGAEPEAVA